MKLLANLFERKVRQRPKPICPHCEQEISMKTRHHLCQKWAEKAKSTTGICKSIISRDEDNIFVEVGNLERLPYLKSCLEQEKMLELENGENTVFYIFPDFS